MRKFFKWIGMAILYVLGFGFYLIFVVAGIGMMIFFFWFGLSFFKGCYQVVVGG